MSHFVRACVPLVLIGLVACTEPSDPEPSAAPDTSTTSTELQQACDPNEPPRQIHPGAACTYEISLDYIKAIDGQGISEGDMELNVKASADGSSISEPGAMPSTDDYFEDRQVSTDGRVIATYVVSPGAPQVVKLCATFTEVDNGGSNGVDDVGTRCKNVTLSAIALPNNRVECPSAPDAPVLNKEVCGDNQCEGTFSATFGIKVKDADHDGVENPEDWTDEICDEELKGQLGRASVVYFHMGDGPFTTFFQGFATNLSKATTGYDYVVIVIDPTRVGPWLLNAAALHSADLVLDPYQDNLYLAMQEVTKRGYDMDIWIWSHGAQEVYAADDGAEHTHIMSLDTDECVSPPGGELCGNGLDDDDDGTTDEASCVAAPAGELCWNQHDDDGDGSVDETAGIFEYELVDDLTLAKIGTDSVPIRMTYSIACFNEGFNDAWYTVGAKVTSGTIGVNFFPTFYGGFADAWNTAASYDSAVLASDNAFDRGLVYTFIEAGGVAFDCDAVAAPNDYLSVLDLNACAEDYFTLVAGDPVDEAGYALDDYDPTQSGTTNMDIQSLRIRTGDGLIQKYVPATLSW